MPETVPSRDEFTVAIEISIEVSLQKLMLYYEISVMDPDAFQLDQDHELWILPVGMKNLCSKQVNKF